MNNGWVVLHRKLLDWEWYGDSKTVHLYVHCLLKANHKPKKWQGNLVKQGQFITSIANLASDTGLSVRNVRTCLERLKSTNELTCKTSNKFTVISITKWSEYQSTDKQTDNQTTGERQTADNQTTTNNNVNNVNNKKNAQIESKEFELFWSNYPRKVNRKKALIGFNNLTKEKQGLATDDCKNRYEHVEKQYIPYPTSYLNGEKWEDEPTPKPEIKEKKPEWAKIPYADDDLWVWAKKHGYPSPGQLTYKQYRSLLMKEVTKKGYL